jgi:hypothetical protein
MGPRLTAAAMILLVAAAFARAQNDPKAPSDKSGSEPSPAPSAAPNAPGGAESDPAMTPVPGGDMKEAKSDSGASFKKSGGAVQEAITKSKGGDGQEAAIIQKKLSSQAAGDSLKIPLDAAAGTAPGGPPAAPARDVLAAGGAARKVTAAAAAANAAAAPAASARNSRAMRRASNAAAAMRNTLPSGDNSGLSAGTGPAGANLTARPPAAKLPDAGSLLGRSSLPQSSNPAGPNPTDPRTASDLVMASQTGFAASIRKEGFKIGPGPGGAPAVLAANGRPATPAEISRLSEVLRAEPAALMRRPDFFAVLPRDHFEQLKADYRSNAAAPGAAFKDIGMSAGDRDFRFSASCSALSGGCNPVVREKSYRKGEDVPPEDLNEVWKKTAAGEKDGDDEMSDFTAADRKEIADAELAEKRMKGGTRRGPTLAGLLAGLGDMADDARGLVGLGGAERPGSAGTSEVPGEAGGGVGGRSSAALSAGEARGFRAWTVPSPSIERKASRRGAAGAVAGLAAAVFFLWRRRRSS